MANILDTVINKAAEWVGPDHNKKEHKTSKMTDHPERKATPYMLGSGLAERAAKMLKKRKDVGDLSQY